MTRLFVAAWPPSEIAEQLAELSRVDEPGVRPVPVENLHVTLRYLGDEAAEVVTGRLERFTLPRAEAAAGPGVTRLDDRQLVVPVVGVESLASAVVQATEHLGQPNHRDFFGHITVARLRRDARSELIGESFVAAFPVAEIRLVESRLEPSGAVYSTIRRFPTV